MNNCSVCDREARIRGLCNLHYQRMKRTGDPMVKMRNRGVDDGAVVLSWQTKTVPCGYCDEPITNFARDINLRIRRSKDGLIFCSNLCRYRAKRNGNPCSICGRMDDLVLTYCRTHYARYRRNGDPLVKQRRGGLQDGAKVVGQGARVKQVAPRHPGLYPYEIAVLMELADGQPRSLGLLMDVTAYAANTIIEAIRRLRSVFGADSIIIESSPRRFRLAEPIPLPVL